MLNDFVTKSDYLGSFLILNPLRLFFNLFFFTYLFERLLFWETRPLSNSPMASPINTRNRYHESLVLEINQCWNQRLNKDEQCHQDTHLRNVEQVYVHAQNLAMVFENSIYVYFYGIKWKKYSTLTQWVSMECIRKNCDHILFFDDNVFNALTLQRL